MTRPLLLLDVDGVLSPAGVSMPPGFERRTTEAYDVVIRPEHGAWIRALLEHYDGVWATTWGQSANAVFGANLNLPQMPALDLGNLARDGTRKLAAVQAYAGDRALAWIDDELYDDATAWARSRSAPTLLRRTRGAVGITEADFEALRAFGRDPLDAAPLRDASAAWHVPGRHR